MAGPDQTIAQTIDDCREHLLGGGRSEMNTLGVAVTTTNATSLTITYPLGGITPGTLISVDDEEMYVFATSPGNNTVAVSRGENNSTPATHLINARVYVNEPFTRFMILKAIMDDIRSWGPQVFQVKSLDITTVPYQMGYDLGAINPYYGVLDVRVTPPPTYNKVDNADWKRLRYKDFQNAPTSEFASGNALILTGAGGLSGSTELSTFSMQGYSQSLHVIYSAPFNASAILSSKEATNLGADVGLDETEFDIPAIGAAWRLMMMREARRATTHMQGEPRAANEVPPLYISKTADEFKRLRDGRLADAQTRLMRMYPWSMAS
jgi:hypothetical protein